MPRRGSRTRSSPVRRFGRSLYHWIVALCAVVVVLFCAYRLAVKPPSMAVRGVGQAQPGIAAPTGSDTQDEWQRKPATYIFLLAASDQSSGNADTIMVCTYDTVNQSIGLVSIPRDTLVDRKIPKINAVYHRGVEEMMDVASDMLGIPIDHYVTADMQGFAALVDELGGIDFEVPVLMNYDDPVQELHIHFSPGMQHLTGQQALEVARCRKNYDSAGNIYDAYPDADIGRTRTQQALLSAILQKALANPQKVARYFSILTSYVTTDLSAGELLWFMEPILSFSSTGGLAAGTLPGDGTITYRGIAWCYQLDREASLEMINTMLNPYTREITMDMTNMLQVG